MNAQQAQSFLHKVMVRYRTKFELQEMVALQGGSSWRTEHIATRAAAVAYNLLAERGKSATITRDEAQRLAEEPDGDKLLEQIGQSLHFNREVLWQEGTASKLRTALAEHLERDDISAVEIDEGRRLTAKGRALAAALVSEKRQAPADLAALLAEADDVTMLNMMMAASPESIGPAAPATPSSATPRELEATAAPSPAKETFAPNIPALLEGLIAHRDEDSPLTDKTAGQMRQAVALFIEATGKQAIEDVQQADVATFVGVMKKLPKAYRKSPKDRDLPLSAFIERGRTLPVDQVGFAGATLNRNLATLGALAVYAKGSGHKVDSNLDPSQLRMRRKSKARKERPPFTLDDLKLLFRHPIWTGCQSAGRRNMPGNVIIRDGRYWVALVLAYTGARLEEIAGLLAGEVDIDHAIPHIQIRVNGNRRLKNPQSERDVPLHPDLIALGFLDYVRAVRPRGEKDLFPDLTPNKEAKGATFGGQVDHPIRQAVTQQLGEARFKNGKAKTIHSFRHYVIGFLNTHKDIRDKVAIDIVGHEGQGEGKKRYGDDAELELKLAAISLLPSVV